ARAAADRGAEVVLVAAHVAGDVLTDAARPGIRTRAVGTAAELGEAMREESTSADVVVMAAAVADYRPAQVSERKITKESGSAPVIELIENDDIVAGLVRRRGEGSGPSGQTIVGFAAETPSDADELRERARRK